MKIMARFLATLFSAVFFISAAQAAPSAPTELRLVYFTGDVQVCDKDNRCAAVAPGRVLAGGEVVKTGADGRAWLRYGKKEKFEVREKSRILVDQITPKASRFQLFVGTFKASIRGGGFFKRRNVAVVTPSGVMAVRGTDFMVSADDAGKVVTDVLYGRVDLRDLAGKRLDDFVQGESGQSYAAPDAGVDAGAAPEGKPEESKSQEGGVEKSGLSQEAFAEAFGGAQGFQSYMENHQDTENRVRDFKTGEAARVAEIVSVVREDSLASGRTLRDRHGNLVRVEQFLFRPSNDQVQFVNLVKRNEYKYSGFFPPSNLASGVRKDFAQATIKFSQGLPENIMEWPSFFADKSESLKVQTVSAKIANNTDNTRQDYFEFNSVYDPSKDRVGGVTCTGATALGSGCFQETIVGFKNGADEGRWRVADCNSTTCSGGTHLGEDADGSNVGDLWSTVEQPLNVEFEYADTLGLVTPGATADMWFLGESYGINNGGGILNIHSILASDIHDPFALMRSVAGETILTVRTNTYDKAANTGGTTIFQRGNIDLVVIPDLAIDLAQKFAAHLSGGL
ncbi:MAG: FecR domain-containing protein [Elusimicrobia bacterium]|nr:FecR domain-containing protein [Elusimicrobiota bacterium]